MRASTIFFIIIAILLGLGVAVGVRASGIFSPKPKEEAKVTAQPLVLVAHRNILENTRLQAGDVQIRPAKNQSERDEVLKQEKTVYLPAVSQAAVGRVARRSILADEPLKKEDLEDLSAPLSIRERLNPGTRAVNVGVLKDHSAGGLIQVGDFVDVMLTSVIDGVEGSRILAGDKSAYIVRNARVIAMRNSLIEKTTPLGACCPVNYVLETNPYRAALLDYAKNKGAVTLLPLSSVERLELEAKLKEVKNSNTIPVVHPVHVRLDSDEYKDEDKRILGILAGTYIVTDADLIRVFKLNYVAPAVVTPVTVQHISGTRLRGVDVFNPDGTRYGEGSTTAGVWQPTQALMGPGGRQVGVVADRYSPWRFYKPDDPACPVYGAVRLTNQGIIVPGTAVNRTGYAVPMGTVGSGGVANIAVRGRG